jgi:hypothetical protein
VRAREGPTDWQQMARSRTDFSGQYARAREGYPAGLKENAGLCGRRSPCAIGHQGGPQILWKAYEATLIVVEKIQLERIPIRQSERAAQDQNVRGGTQTTPKKERVNALLPTPLPPYNPSLVEPLIPPQAREALRPTTIIEGSRAAQ